MSVLVPADQAAFPQYHWMAIAAILFSFFMAFGIGANDVANAFATSVAAKSVSLRQAVIIASVFEFAGSLFLGASVTNTIRSKILDIDMYDDEPEVLMFGMLCALVTASIILIVATAMSLPVSTTHTIVGAIIGFSLAAKGWSSVQWFDTGMIFVSWVASPVLTGLMAAMFFVTVRKLVLYSDSPYARAIKTYPLVLFVTLTINSLFVLYKAASQNSKVKSLSSAVIVPVSFGIGALSALIFQFAISPMLQKKISNDRADREAEPVKELSEGTDADAGIEEKAAGEVGNETDDVKDSIHANKPNADAGPDEKNVLKKAYTSFASATYDQDLEKQSMSEHAKTAKIWAEAETFDAEAEQMFSYLQVFTACLLSFGHGANDVANAIAPLSAVIVIYETGSVPSKSKVPRWALAMGGAGIVAGLLFYGYKLMKALGFRLAKLSPSRGFCIELAASLVVVVASFIGVPVSSTQCQVGGTIGVGFTGGKSQVDWMFVLKVVFGWVGSFVSVVLASAGVFAFAFYSPAAVGFAA